MTEAIAVSALRKSYGKTVALDGLDLSVAEGTLYPILNRLRVEGLLESEWVDSGTGHPRKYYKLTDAGRRRVKEMSRAWVEFSDKLNGILKSIGMKGNL